jgi:hypothetical protein
MFDCDVNLGQCTEIRFIEHKAYSCSKNGSSCKDLKRQPWDAGAQVMAYVLGRGLTHVKGCLRRENSKHEKEVGFSVGESLRDLYDALAEGGVSGTHKNPKRADVVLRGALLQYGCSRTGCLRVSRNADLLDHDVIRVTSFARTGAAKAL